MDYIDLYCERVQPGLFGEPLNAITNLAFIFAAWLCWKQYGQNGEKMDRSGALILSLIAVLGVGSALFHTFATYWSLLADVIPIAIFVHTFLFFAMKRFFGLNTRWALGITVLFGGLSITVAIFVPDSWLNGSVTYFAPMVGIFVIGFTMRHLGIPHGRLLIVAGGVFALSVGARTVDMDLCQVIPFGTHFLWHILNGVSLYFVGKAYLLNFNSSAVQP